MKEIARHPAIKWTVIIISGGVITAAIAVAALFCLMSWMLADAEANSKNCYAGAETQGHYLLQAIPFQIPGQKEKELPFIMDDRGMCDNSPTILFQASPKWIADFQARHNLKLTDEGMENISTCYRHLCRGIAKKPELKPLLEGCVWKKMDSHGRHILVRQGKTEISLFEAYVDEQKGYVLLNFLFQSAANIPTEEETP